MSCQNLKFQAISLSVATLIVGAAANPALADYEKAYGNAIAITGGSITTGGEYGSAITGTISTASQGSLSFTTSNYTTPYGERSIQESIGEKQGLGSNVLLLGVSGTGYTPDGFYTFSNVATTVYTESPIVVFYDYGQSSDDQNGQQKAVTSLIGPSFTKSNATFGIAGGYFNDYEAYLYQNYEVYPYQNDYQDSTYQDSDQPVFLSNLSLITDIDVSNPELFSFEPFSFVSYSDSTGTQQPLNEAGANAYKEFSDSLGNDESPESLRSDRLYSRIFPSFGLSQ